MDNGSIVRRLSSVVCRPVRAFNQRGLQRGGQVVQCLAGELRPTGGVRGGHGHPLPHRAPAPWVKQVRAGQRQRRGVLRLAQLEHHRAVVERGKRLARMLEAGHAEHFAALHLVRCGQRGGNGVVFGAGVGGHGWFFLPGGKDTAAYQSSLQSPYSELAAH